MTNDEILEGFIQLAKYLMNEKKHVHLEPLQATDVIRAIRELQKENADLKSQIKSFENDFDYQSKKIAELQKDLKSVRCAYIQEKVGNLCNGVDMESIMKNVFQYCNK